MDLILLAIFSYALYRMAISYNITPWKWIIRYVVAFFASMVALIMVLIGIYGPNKMADMLAVQKILVTIEQFTWLYQFVLFFFFRMRIVRYVHNLDQIDKNNNNDIPNTPSPKKGPKDPKDQKDFSYFR